MHLLSKRMLILLSPQYLAFKNTYDYAFHHIISSMSLPMHPWYLIRAHAYRIARRNHPLRVRSRGGESGDTLAHSSRRRGAGSRRTTRVPWSPAYFFSERKASEHYKPPMFYKISLESFMFDALGSKSRLETLGAWNYLVPIYTLNPM